MKKHDTIVILDFGSQVTQLICRRLRDSGVYAVILPFNASGELLRSYEPKGLIFSGGPAGVYESNAPKPQEAAWSLDCPVLGICYGLQLIAERFDGKVLDAQQHEYGRASLMADVRSPLFRNVKPETMVWMSHGDSVVELPEEFQIIGFTSASRFAAVTNGRFWGVQFHPEVTHTDHGREMLRNFAVAICGCAPTWRVENEVGELLADIRERVGTRQVLHAVSGGVDSTTLARLLRQAIGDRLRCLTIDTGLLREDELVEVLDLFAAADLGGVEVLDAKDRFLRALTGVVDPEEKRRVISHHYTDCLLERLDSDWVLSQGTLYPDTIESRSVVGPASTIKSHHNLSPRLRDLGDRLLEPLRFFFKDEVRRIGKKIGVPDAVLGRHPFPGPGLAVRVLGEVTPARLATLRRVDAIYLNAIRSAGFYDAIAQALAALIPVEAVGVTGDSRRVGSIVMLRAVVTDDFMTAKPFLFPPDFLCEVTRQIVNEVKEVARVTYEYTEKPPSTIEPQ